MLDIIVKITGSRIHERTISLRFRDIILRVFRLEVPYTMFTLQTSFKPLLLKGEGVGKIHLVEAAVNSRRKTLKSFVLIKSKNSATAHNSFFYRNPCKQYSLPKCGKAVRAAASIGSYLSLQLRKRSSFRREVKPTSPLASPITSGKEFCL
jgi:hypothetical protein